MLHLLKLSKTVVKTKDQIYAEFRDLVNMGSGELGKFLYSKESKLVDAEPQETDISPRKAGDRTIKILRKKRFELTKSNFEHMERVIAYLPKKIAERPEGDLAESIWRYSLMSWGHDPLKAPKIK
ncbi:DUF3140 domain-containing protein [Adhaeribacter pallidiroseus]|uniref:DUF3140 domain-containing protein n=1 Tax=Adhaeribacter pallidiroseus TaxID=2072847 RepID=A0A369QMP9_9BACT|nr:DUF3140 domain-containing protein [Adhaeribacter pallidiroseus]RDC64496.1 hypothetical protein AHMF7616_03110 [Adhaeribacter pallidiroseus]